MAVRARSASSRGARAYVCNEWRNCATNCEGAGGGIGPKQGRKMRGRKRGDYRNELRLLLQANMGDITG